MLLVACGGGAILPDGGPRRVGFRAISERENAALCVHGPAFALAHDALEWGDIWKRHVECQPTGPEAPPLLKTEAGVAAWWKVAPCLGHGVRTVSVTAAGTTITVTAEEIAPVGEFCAQAIGGLESFLALDLAAVATAERIRFVLDGVEVGSIPTRA